MGEISRGAPITPTYAPFYIRSPEGILFFFRGEDFSGFSPEPFPGAITTAAATTVITTAITPPVTITTAITAISGIPIRVKAFPFKEIFQKVNANTFL